MLASLLSGSFCNIILVDFISYLFNVHSDLSKLINSNNHCNAVYLIDRPNRRQISDKSILK